MKCKDCTVFGCQYRTTDAEKDCYYETQYTAKEPFNWESFRAEAAKAVLCAMIARGEKVKDIVVSIAIDGADKLIKELKEKEEK